MDQVNYDEQLHEISQKMGQAKQAGNDEEAEELSYEYDGIFADQQSAAKADSRAGGVIQNRLSDTSRRRKKPSLPGFPLEVYRDPKVRKLAERVASLTHTPVTAAGFTILGMLSAAYGTQLQLRLREGRVTWCHLYACLLMPTGHGKSPIFSAFETPLVELQEEIRETGRGELREVHIEREMLETEHTALKRKIGNKAGKMTDDDRAKFRADLSTNKQQLEEVSEALELPRLLTNDITGESFVKLQAMNDGRLTILSDETPFFGIIGGRYSNEKPRIEAFLNAHTGKSYTSDRVTSGYNHVKCSRLAILVATQPQVVESLASQPELDDRGMLGRFVFCHVEADVGWRTFSDASISPEDRARYDEIIHDLGLEAFGRREPWVLDLSAAAYGAYRTWWGETEAKRRPGGELDGLQAFGTKVDDLVLRVAGLLHMLNDSPTDPVTVETFEDAAKVVDFLVAHFGHTYSLIKGSPAKVLGKKIRTWYEEKDHQTCDHE